MSKCLLSVYTTSFNIKTFHILSTTRMYVSCLDPRKNSDYFCVQNWLIFITKKKIVFIAR